VHLRESSEDEVSERVSGQSALPSEPVLEHVGQRAA
jgi:hypothetical protein